jgi:hypothetical protein
MSGSLSKLTESLSERLLFREELVGIGVLVVALRGTSCLSFVCHVASTERARVAQGTALSSARIGAQAVRTRRRSARFETKKGLIGYVQFKAWHTTASTFLYEILTNRSTLLGAERLQATLAVAFQEVLCLLAFVLAAFLLGFCTFF